jgi:short-subunit dehydrogenase
MSGALRERYGPWAAVLGAGQGIGLAFAEELAGEGFSLLLVDACAETLAAAAPSAARCGAKEVASARIDLGAPDCAARLQEALGARDLGLVVYTAMLPLTGAFLSHPLERHAQAVAAGVSGVLAASHALGGRLVARGRGGLILTSSLAGFQGTGWVAEYAAVKAFDLVLAEGLWWEWRPLGVDVLALCPGNTATPGLLQNRPNADPATFADPRAVAREALAHLPLARERGPICIPGEDNRSVRAAFDQLPRKQVVELIGASTKQMFAR